MHVVGDDDCSPQYFAAIFVVITLVAGFSAYRVVERLPRLLSVERSNPIRSALVSVTLLLRDNGLYLCQMK